MKREGPEMVCAALVLVGNELISGNIADENRVFVARELQAVGVKTMSVHMVRDDVDATADLVRHLASRATYVITIGGLGPTVDDVTLEAVARAFGLAVAVRQADGSSSYAQMSGSEVVQPLLHRVPIGSEVISSPHGPVVRTHNVYSLPGLPRLVRARFPALVQRLGGCNIHSRQVSFRLPQSHLAQALGEATRQYPAVSIGCYPSSDPGAGTSVTFEGSDIQDIDDCMSFIQRALTSADEAPGRI